MAITHALGAYLIDLNIEQFDLAQQLIIHNRSRVDTIYISYCTSVSSCTFLHVQPPLVHHDLDK